MEQQLQQDNIEPGKIFVGGLSWETSKENLQSYFEQYGQVADSVIMMDPVTKKPRGFGFITYVDPVSVQKVLASGPHVLDSKTVDPKPATVKTQAPPVGQGPSAQSATAPVKKIFVGGIAAGTTEDDVRAYFLQHGGPVTEIDLKVDKQTQRMRGFGFVGFESEDVVEKLCEQHFHQINGKTVEVKKAEPRFSAGGGVSYRGGGMGGGGFGHNYGQGGYGGGAGRGGGYGGGQYPYSQHYSRGGYGAHPQQYPQYGYGYSQGSYGGQYTGQTGGYGGYSGYEGYPSGQQTRGTGDQSRSDYGTGYGYGTSYAQGGHMPQDVSYSARSTYAAQEPYNQQGSYNYGEASAAYNYPELQGGGYGSGRGGARSSYGGTH